jgi:hypothetical protein
VFGLEFVLGLGLELGLGSELALDVCQRVEGAKRLGLGLVFRVKRV